MQILNGNIQVSDIRTLNPVNFSTQFPYTCLPSDDSWLNSVGFARISNPNDYIFNPATQTLLPQTPVYNATTGLWDAYTVQNLSNTDMLTAEIIVKITALSNKYLAIIAAGFNYNNNNFQIDNSSAQLMLTVKVQITSGIPGLGYWVASNNLEIPMDDATVIDFINAAYVYGAACKGTFFAKRKALMQAQTQADIDAVTVDTGWPSN